MKNKHGLSIERIRELFNYNPDTGILTSKIKRHTLKVGDLVGGVGKFGYIQLKIDDKQYKAHRIIWAHYYGVWPELFLDHINRVTSDNRIVNLREATNSQNKKNQKLMSNNKSGFVGVCWHIHNQSWMASCMVNGKLHHLGYFDDIKEAAKVQHDFSVKHFGEFVCKNYVGEEDAGV